MKERPHASASGSAESPNSPSKRSNRSGAGDSTFSDTGGGKLEVLRNVLSKAATAKSNWPDKDDLLDIVYWMRQVCALILGIMCALVPLRGVLALALYVVLSTLAGHFYVTQFQGVDEETVGGAWELAKEGFGSAFATFMICWIVGYSALYFP